MKNIQISYGTFGSTPFPMLQYYWEATKQVSFYPEHNLKSGDEYCAGEALVAIWKVKHKK
jgi:hypothetical protein